MSANENQMYRGDFREMLRNPAALIGGVAGAIISSALLYIGFAVVAMNAANANADNEDEELEIEFEPGALVRLGQKIDDKELPEKIITQDTRAEEAETPPATVTEDEKAKPTTEEKKDPPKDKPKLPPNPNAEKKDPKLPTSPTPTKKNTPYNDLPTVDYNIGDPFGDPGGWADRAKDGDPWATAVMKALNNLKVGAYAAKGGGGDYRFQLTICKDGSVKTVTGKGGSLPADGQRAVQLSIEQMDIPKPPAEVAKKMKSDCAKIRYTFAWSAGGVK
jgi:hypothetical protein